MFVPRLKKNFCFSLPCASYLKDPCLSILIGFWVGNLKKVKHSKHQKYQEKYQVNKGPGDSPDFEGKNDEKKLLFFFVLRLV